MFVCSWIKCYKQNILCRYRNHTLSVSLKPRNYLDQCWNILNLTLRNKLQWNTNRKQCISIQENALENVVCEISPIFSGSMFGWCRWQLLTDEISQGIAALRELEHWGRDKMADILQTTFWNAFPWMEIFEFRLRFHWGLSLRIQLTIFQHWLRQWLCADQATSHYLNQWWLVYRRMYGLTYCSHLASDILVNNGLGIYICMYDRRQAITWTNGELRSAENAGSNFGEINILSRQCI